MLQFCGKRQGDGGEASSAGTGQARFSEHDFGFRRYFRRLNGSISGALAEPAGEKRNRRVSDQWLPPLICLSSTKGARRAPFDPDRFPTGFRRACEPEN